jgi:hypothetical protein
MITGQRVLIQSADGGPDLEGVVVAGSDNRKSLMVQCEAAILVAGGMYAGAIPLLFDDASGEYRDLIAGQIVKLKWLDDENESKQNG